MEKEQNTLIFMFIIVIIIGGIFVFMKKTDINFDFLKKDQDTQDKQEPEKDYSEYKGTYYDQQEGNVKLIISSISTTKIDFSLEVTEDEKVIELKEYEMKDIADESYHFEYKDTYDNPGEGRITLSNGNIFLTLDTDIPDTNTEGLSIGNFGSIKLTKEKATQIDYEGLKGTYKVPVEEDNAVLIVEIKDIEKRALNLKLIYEKNNGDGTTTQNSFGTTFERNIDDSYEFTYSNETLTAKGTGALMYKDNKLYITLNDKDSIEKIIPTIVYKELISEKEEEEAPVVEEPTEKKQ